MLIIKRALEEKIVFRDRATKEVLAVVTLVEVCGPRRARLGIVGRPDVLIFREEIDPHAAPQGAAAAVDPRDIEL